MSNFRIKRLEDAEYVSYGPASELHVLIGDADQSTPIRSALQTCQPNYHVPFHSHPYIEYLIVMQGGAEFKIEQEDGVKTAVLTEGDCVELQANTWHSFTTQDEGVTKLLGIHISPERLVNYKPGVKTDARGFRVEE